MPSFLLKTTQRAEFLEMVQADMNALVMQYHNNQITLDLHRTAYTMKVLIGTQEKGVKNEGTNVYLHEKSKQHRNMINNERRAQYAFEFFQKRHHKKLGARFIHHCIAITSDYLPHSDKDPLSSLSLSN